MKNVTATAEMKYCTFPDSLESVLVQRRTYQLLLCERETEKMSER